MSRALLKFLAATTVMVPLAGCMTSGTNMHGDFACRAPNGTCAPMSTIDAKAVAGMGALTQPIGGIVDPALPREGRVVTASDRSPPARSSDRVLRVVFPAHIDPSGIYHDESTAHAVVERGGWTDGMTGGVRRSSATVASAAMMQQPKPDDLQTGKLATLDEVIAARAAIAGQVPTARLPGPPERAAGVAPIALRVPFAIGLREAAAAASAQPVAGLDPNFDTPDVTSAAAAGDDAQGTCTVYRKVRWHGHNYRRPFQRPCPVVATVAAGVPVAAGPGVTVTTRSLNLARLDPASLSPEVAAAPSISAKASVASPTFVGPRNPVDATATSAAPSVVGALAPGARYAPTEDRQLAAARVRSMAAPLIAETARRGRDEARAQDVNLGGMFARAGAPSTASADTSEAAPR